MVLAILGAGSSVVAEEKTGLSFMICASFENNVVQIIGPNDEESKSIRGWLKIRQILTRRLIAVLARSVALFLPKWARVLSRGEIHRHISMLGDLP